MPLTDTLTETLRDAVYVTVGLGLLGVQKAQVRRRDLESQLAGVARQVEEQLAPQRQAVLDLATQLESYVTPVRAQLETQLDALSANLPPQVHEYVEQARAIAKETESQLRVRFGLAA